MAHKVKNVTYKNPPENGDRLYLGKYSVCLQKLHFHKLFLNMRY